VQSEAEQRTLLLPLRHGSTAPLPASTEQSICDLDLLWYVEC